VHRSWSGAHGGFAPRDRIAADDDLMRRLLSGLTARQVVYLPEVLVRMRTGGASNRSLRNLLRKSSEDDRALRANGVGGVGPGLEDSVEAGAVCGAIAVVAPSSPALLPVGEKGDRRVRAGTG
jgi:hypothetical protein